ncbi:MAG: metallophosphatase domain-containing protein [Myxococcales bacterium]|nr:metallophosphatase domain-containing protein [Myxococcales bacterium]
MRVVCISDTHGRHARVQLPSADVLVHAGDATQRGGFDELEATFDWMAAQAVSHRLFVAGNHDLCCEQRPERARAAAAARGITYLCDEPATVAGLRVWGSPITPRFRDMAFNRERGAAIAEHWAAIPEGLDLLVTHGPPKGVGDRMFLGLRVGCEDLLARVRRVQPRAHVFGHIHEAAGRHRVEGLRTEFINAASSRLVPLVRAPVVLEL